MAGSLQEIREGLDYMRRCRGTRYIGWNGVWPPNQPVFYMGTGKPPSPEVVRQKGVLCSGALNLFARFVRLKGGQGTLWWQNNLENKRQFRSGTHYPVGTVLGYPFERDNDGHVVIVSTEPDENGDQLTIGADVPFGLNEKRTVKSAHATFNFSYAAEIPGIGVIPAGGAGASEDVVELIDDLLDGHGEMIIEEARRARLELALACALVQQESLGRNIFGHDWGDRLADRVPFAHLPVTKARVQVLLRHVNSGGASNGVGLTQLTYPPFIRKAEEMGGAHIPRNQCRVGFQLLASYVEKYSYKEALGAYNAGEPNRQEGIENGYAKELSDKHQEWKERLSGRLTEPDTTRDSRIVLGSYSHPLSELAHLAGAALHHAGVECEVATGQRFVQLEEQCWKAKIGVYRFVVIGGPTFEKLPDDRRKYVQPASKDFDPEHSDYVGCVGESLDETRRLLTAELNRIEEGAGAYFARLSSPGQRGEPSSDDEEQERRKRRDGRAKEEREEEVVYSGPGEEPAEKDPLVQAAKRKRRAAARRDGGSYEPDGSEPMETDGAEPVERVKGEDLGDGELEEIGREVLRLIRNYTGQGKTPRMESGARKKKEGD